MFVLRMVVSVTVSMLTLSCVGCETSHAPKDVASDSRPTKAQAVKASDEKPKKVKVDTKKNDPMAEYRTKKKTWCDDRPVQIQEENHPDGKPKYRYEVVMNEEGEFVRHGKSSTWWETGQKKLELHYVCGAKHGPKRTWWPDGTDWSVGGFFDGKDHNTWIVWDNGGVKTKQYRILKGVWHGNFTTWHPNGKKRFEVEFVDGLRQGNMIFWDDHGNVIKTIEYLDGKEQPMPGG